MGGLNETLTEWIIRNMFELKNSMSSLYSLHVSCLAKNAPLFCWPLNSETKQIWSLVSKFSLYVVITRGRAKSCNCRINSKPLAESGICNVRVWTMGVWHHLSYLRILCAATQSCFSMCTIQYSHTAPVNDNLRNKQIIIGHKKIGSSFFEKKKVFNITSQWEHNTTCHEL